MPPSVSEKIRNVLNVLRKGVVASIKITIVRLSLTSPMFSIFLNEKS